MAETSLEMLQTLFQRCLDGQNALQAGMGSVRQEMSSLRTEVGVIREENGAIRTVLLGLGEQGRRTERRVAKLDRRLDEVKDDMELMIRSEMMGRLGNFEIRFERRLEALAETIGATPHPPA
jgi:predicted nuclease with TOPRIM domain